MNPRVAAVTPTNDYKLEIAFTNGEFGVFDCSPFLGIGVFRELRDVNYFKQAFVEGGTVVWPHEQDICPDTLYADATRLVVSEAEQADEPEPSKRPQIP